MEDVMVVEKGKTSCKTFIKDSLLESKMAYQPMHVKLLHGHILWALEKLCGEETIAFIKSLLKGK